MENEVQIKIQGIFAFSNESTKKLRLSKIKRLSRFCVRLSDRDYGNAIQKFPALINDHDHFK